MGVACGLTSYVNILGSPNPPLARYDISILRIELFMTVLAGFAGGLAGTLWGGLVSAALLARRPEIRANGWLPDTGWRVLHTAALYGLCGALSGLLFWLAWGLPAFAAATAWYLVGMAYGGLLWSIVALPALWFLALRVPAVRYACLVLAVEALVAALAS